MLLNTVLFLVTLTVGLLCLALALRCCGLTSIPLGRRALSLEKPVQGLRGEAFTPAMGVTALLWGLVVLHIYYFASYFFCVISHDGISWAVFRQSWTQWDANNYLRIAELGYAGFSQEGMHTTLVFYPLYPWLMRLVHIVIPSWFVCGLAVSSLSFMAGCYMLARLVTEDFGWPAARMTLLLMSAYPFSFFFASVYGESLFLALSVTAFYCIRRHRWLQAGLWGALASMTRMQGVLLLCAGAAEYAVAERPLKKLEARDWRALGRDTVRILLPLFIMLAGVGVYLAVNYAVDGDPFQFVHYEKAVWSQGFAPMPDCLRTIWTNLVKRWGQPLAATTWGPDLAVFVLCLGTLIYAARRLPAAWLAYFLSCVLLNFSLNWPLSCGRYIACAFPLFVTLAIAFRRRPLLGYLLALAWATLQGLALSVYLSGGHIV